MLDETLIIWCGEFGRSPDNGLRGGGVAYGRDHNPTAMAMWFAGGGVKPGRVVGESDQRAAYCKSRPFYPSDVGATVYTALGVNPRAEIRDHLDRPYKLNSGKVMRPLFG